MGAVGAAVQRGGPGRFGRRDAERWRADTGCPADTGSHASTDRRRPDAGGARRGARAPGDLPGGHPRRRHPDDGLPPPGPARRARRPPRHRPRRLGADDRGRRHPAHDRALARQRARPRRRPRLAPPRPPPGAPRHARLHGPRQHERQPRQRHPRRRDRPRHGRPRPARRHRARGRDAARADVDGFVLTLWLIRILFLALLYAFLFAVARILAPRPARRRRGARASSAGWSSSRRPAASRRSARRSRSTRSPPSAGT